MAISEGYPVEEHIARTPDGYLLRVQRIPPGAKGPGLPPVLLVHGMLGSASDFLVMGRGRSLGRNYQIYRSVISDGYLLRMQRISPGDKGPGMPPCCWARERLPHQSIWVE